MWKNLLVLVPLVLSSVQGGELLPANSQLCVLACQDSLGSVTFGTTVKTDDYYTGHCEDTLRFESTYICAHKHCSPREIKSGLEYLQVTCDMVHMAIPSYDEAVARYSMQETPTMAYGDVFKDAVNNTLVPDTELFDLGYRTWVSMPRNAR